MRMMITKPDVGLLLANKKQREEVYISIFIKMITMMRVDIDKTIESESDPSDRIGTCCMQHVKYGTKDKRGSSNALRMQCVMVYRSVPACAAALSWVCYK